MTSAKSKNLFRLKAGLFANYFVHGFALIILTQNLSNLARNWHSTLAMASFILSGIGIGRVVAYLIMGWISDHFGRKPSLLTGMLSYFIFFTVTPFNHVLWLAYILAIIAGVSNSALDSATYPLFTELNPKSDANNILIKAFISTGEFLLPLIMIELNVHKLWFGFSFDLPVLVLILNFFNILTIKFPNIRKIEDRQASNNLQLKGLRKHVITTAIMVYGYTSMAAMIWFTQWVTIFAKRIGYSDSLSHFLMSIYSIGSISGVIISFLIAKYFNDHNKWFLTLNVMEVATIACFAFSRIPALSVIASLLFGFSCAGGVMQMALNILLSIFPKRKGLFTGIYFVFGSIASFTVPIITGKLVEIGTSNVMEDDVVVAVIGLISAGLIFGLYPKVSSLNQMRDKINLIDKSLVKLLNQRFKTVHAVGLLKKRQHLATEDKGREAQVLNGIGKMTRPSNLAPYNEDIVQNIMNNSKKYEDFLKQK